ncbi:hypothetical protein C1T17_04295 [Sphingobium sp. SCG-1]|uniref:hypothetical protein n=1 Tax=Sphingobium sp. SCG-1 TaxID=2072936 RepID=UPI000CD6A178|nr:hypothetical protein [Sphingobium sp. SCG-1]AUW57438.1 hypothetical protein C1T17_04295 [Sphingobium sp. SCG-1]
MSSADRINAVPISGPLLEAALKILAALPAHLYARPVAQALALQAYAREAGFEDEAASAALHARVTALAKWTGAHDPGRQSDPGSVVEAAARFSLAETEAGIGFKPGGLCWGSLFGYCPVITAAQHLSVHSTLYHFMTSA